MKNTFSRKFTVCTFAGVLGAAFIGCGDDGSSSPKGTGLPAEVADMEELETYECSMDVIGEKVFVESEDLLYECDGDAWFKSYDQTKPSSTSTKSSSSKKSDGSSDSKNSDKDGSSSSDATTSSSSAKSSSSRPTEILEPEITVNETCTEVGACDAMVKTDISTWHFVRKDNFGDDAEYTYTVDGKDLIVTIKSADGSTDSKTYSMYNMESEAGVEMAFNAAKSTCKNGGGNDNKVKSCVKDTVKALPECDASREGFIGKKDSSSYVACKSGSWVKATDLEIELKSACVKDLRGEMMPAYDLEKMDSVFYVCGISGWRDAWTFEIAVGSGCTESLLGEIRSVYPSPYNSRDTIYFICKKAGDDWREASSLERNTYKKECPKDFKLVPGNIHTDMLYVCDSSSFREATGSEQAIGLGCTSENLGAKIDLEGYPLKCYKFSESGSWGLDDESIVEGTFTDKRDGRAYRTVTYGSHTWMAENLNYAYKGVKYNYNGYTFDSTSWCYNNDTDYCDEYGRLYTWSAAVDSAGIMNDDCENCGFESSAVPKRTPVRGICPDGWYLPDSTEWLLFLQVASFWNSFSKERLQSENLWKDGKGTDYWKFSVKPSGIKKSTLCVGDCFYNLGFSASFWSSTPHDFNEKKDAAMASIDQVSIGMGSFRHSKTTAYSVRCIKDSD
ncbi:MULTISPECIES: FISUMP domain-containing protein [unclassified Fibrobacter]|uniref:FISUMP domain-containing protein n=1 Tax=unclassified Fibrobacter TaxID=2634177 RepID=UPI000915DD7D|nr:MULTISPECIES: FISUMP domain-containing protein [Fibrobacter]MCL4101934.1 hypothetical protein [Fibrobacter succinogenes]MCQ2099957.1 hypothetical protein [Fibrobacter sp.]SHK78605.1 major paralogous domain-containing protein [Fibrobacter sp. UWH6]